MFLIFLCLVFSLFFKIPSIFSLLLRRECCTFSNGEYVKSGLAELEKWIVNAKEEVDWHFYTFEILALWVTKYLWNVVCRDILAWAQLHTTSCWVLGIKIVLFWLDLNGVKRVVISLIFNFLCLNSAGNTPEKKEIFGRDSKRSLSGMIVKLSYCPIYHIL